MVKPVIGYKPCENCNFEMPIKKYYESKRFCSAKCRANKIPMPEFTPFIKGHKPWNKGIEWKELSIQRQAEGNPMWKGDKASYSQIHHWVRARLPKPKECQKCGEVRSLHMSNISYEYKRDLSDWIYLCVPCHSKADRESGKWGFATKKYGLH